MDLIRIVFRNLLRNKTRTALTVFSIGMAVVVLVALRLGAAMKREFNQHSLGDRLVVRAKYGVFRPQPRKHVDQIRGVPGVRRVTYISGIPSFWEGRPDVLITNAAVDPETYFSVNAEVLNIAPDVLAKWRADKQAAVVDPDMAATMGWKIGDRIRLRSIIPSQGTYDQTLVGFYTATAPTYKNKIFSHWSYLNDRLPERSKDMVTLVHADVTDRSRATAVAKQIDKLFENTDVETATHSYDFLSRFVVAGMTGVLRLLSFVSLGVALVIFLIVGNSISISVRERSAEYGVLRVLGCSGTEVLMVIAGEGLVVGLLGGLFGIVVGYPLIEKVAGPWLSVRLAAITGYAPSHVTMDGVVVGVVAATLLGAVAAMTASLGPLRRPLAETVKR